MREPSSSYFRREAMPSYLAAGMLAFGVAGHAKTAVAATPPAVSPEERLYDQASYREQAIPYPLSYSADPAAEQSVVDNRLAQFQASLVTAVKLGSGEQFNFYRSGFDSTNYRVDARALSVMMTRLKQQAPQVPDSPIKPESEQMRRESRAGQVLGTFSIILVSSRRLCLPEPQPFDEELDLGKSPFVDASDPECVATGSESGIVSGPARNPVIVATNVAGEQPPKQYLLEPAARKNRLFNKATPAELSRILILIHELGHSMMGRTIMNGALSSDDEHRRFVLPLTERMYKVYSSLDRSKSRVMRMTKAVRAMTPFHIVKP